MQVPCAHVVAPVQLTPPLWFDVSKWLSYHLKTMDGWKYAISSINNKCIGAEITYHWPYKAAPEPEVGVGEVVVVVVLVDNVVDVVDFVELVVVDFVEVVPAVVVDFRGSNLSLSHIGQGQELCSW